MKGRVWPRPFHLVEGERRPIKGRSTWTYEFAVRGDDGRRRFVTKGGFATKREAEAALTTALSGHQEAPARTLVKPSAMTFGDFIGQEWLPALPHRLKATTVESYTQLARDYVTPNIGAVRLRDLTPGRIAALYGHLRERGGHNGRALSDTTVHHVHVLLVRVLGFAVDTGALKVSPLASLPKDLRPRPARRSADDLRHWTPDQAKAYLAAARQERLYALHVLALNIGLRRGELIGLQWGDVDLEAGTLAVRRSRTSVGRSVVESAPKTANARRTIELDLAVVDALRSHRRQQLTERLAWGEAWADTGYMFTREDGHPLRPDAVRELVRPVAGRAGVPWIGVHGMRHTSAVLALAAGVPAKVVAERLGHYSAAFTLDTYAHVVPGMQRAASAAISAAMGLS